MSRLTQPEQRAEPRRHLTVKSQFQLIYSMFFAALMTDHGYLMSGLQVPIVRCLAALGHPTPKSSIPVARERQHLAGYGRSPSTCTAAARRAFAVNAEPQFGQ